MNEYIFDWSQMAFGSKKPLREINATFIAAPREISPQRFTQLVKSYLPQGNIVLGLAKEPYVLELENQPQFEMLTEDIVAPIINKVNASATPHKIYTLCYTQRDLPYILEKITFPKVILVNGSWYRVFHSRPEYYALAKSKTPYELISPFTDEQEAKAYVTSTKLPEIPRAGQFSAEEMLGIADQAARHSYDYNFQIGISLGRQIKSKIDLLATAHNAVIPYETFAMHHGAAREKNFSPMNDLNHYDTNHAEIEMLIKAQKEKIDLKGTTLFINVLPCPACTRMFCSTDIEEFVYSQDHSAGYGVWMLEAAGKKVRRIVVQS